MMSTVRMPVAGMPMSGWALDQSPLPAAPVKRMTPASRMAPVMAVCTKAAVRMPMTLIQVMTTVAPTPIATKPRCTGASSTCHSVVMRISGNRYSTAVGSATDSNRHTTAYAISSAQVQTNDQPGPSAARV